MIKSVRGLGLRFFKKNKFTAISSIVSVMLAVSLIVTMIVFSSHAKQSVINEVKNVYGDMDLSVGYNPDQNKLMDKSLLQNIKKQENIEYMSKVLVNHLQVNKLNVAIYTVGVQNDSLSKSRYHFSENLSNEEVTLNDGLAETLQVKVGEKIEIENKSYVVKEVLPDIEAGGSAPDILILSEDAVKQHVYEKTGKHNEATYVLIKAKENADVLALSSQIHKIDEELRIDIAEEDEFFKSNLASLHIFIIVLSALILIITALLLMSNFEVFLYKYKSQFAIMRSMGATTKQMFKVIFIQCSVINFFGGIFGLLLAVISDRFLQSWLEQLFAFQMNSMGFDYEVAIVTMICSIFFIELFMLYPSYRSSKILPVKLMRENEESDFSNKKTRSIMGKFLLISSIFLTVLGGFVANKGDTQAIVIGAIFLFLGVYILFPTYLSTILIVCLPIMKKIFGRNTFVAIKNVIPQVRKNTFVILMISTMMVIVVFGSTIFKTMQKNNERYLKREFPTHIVVENRLTNDSTIILPHIQNIFKEISSVKGASTISTNSLAELKQGENYITFDYNLGDLKEMEKQGLLPEVPANLENSIIVTKELAERYKLHAGDIVQLGLFSEQEQKVRPTSKVEIGLIVNELPNSPAVLMDWSNVTYKQDYTVFERAFISSNNERETLEQLKKLKGQYPQLKISSYTQSLKQSNLMFQQRWSIFIVVIIVILLSVTLGVCNTLINNIQSKRKEFAILRAIIVKKKGIVQVILTQVKLYVLIGIVLGVVIGTLLTYMVSIIDRTPLFFNFKLIVTVIAGMFGIVLIIFLPFANRIGKRDIVQELNKDNK
ncbi:FtsX-like permease family protein [Bacillus wiedmannii]|uniref:FtsX-like permease family protein n=1 Tax=Bacillus wiedmannii TaxID=1890302 RepID=UPI001D0E5106|nr:FtsX-like permease family protein [Bacillus wiedmannii]MCC2323868.1 FtsX-like permease family protein [Bacillus wiedmannii]